MPVIHLEPATATDPDRIPAAGGRVTFTVRALCPTGQQQARFNFFLRSDDGYRWNNGGTSIEKSATINETLRDIPFELVLRQVDQTGAQVLFIDVEGSVAVGTAVMRSLARLTVDGGLQELLVAHRDVNGLTRSELAATLNISPSWLGKLENGASPSKKLLENMKQVLEA